MNRRSAARGRLTGPPMPAVRAMPAVLAALLAGCAGPRIDAQWSDPQLRSRPLQGQRVLVVCDAWDVTVRRLCQDGMADELVAHGATPVRGADRAATPGQPPDDAPHLPAARSAGAAAVLATSVSLADVGQTPPVSVGIGGWGLGGGSVRGGVGVSVPLGGGRVVQGYAAEARLTDVASGRLVWSARASAAPSANAESQLRSLADTLLDAAARAGVF